MIAVAIVSAVVMATVTVATNTLRPTAAMVRAALHRHWALAVPFYGSERMALPHARMHAIKYGQYHKDPTWARERMVTMRGPEAFLPLCDEVFADAGDAGRTRELSAADAIVPALQSCTE